MNPGGAHDEMKEIRAGHARAYLFQDSIPFPYQNPWEEGNDVSVGFQQPLFITAADHHFGYSYGRHGIRDRDTLCIFPACTDREAEVIADHID